MFGNGVFQHGWQHDILNCLATWHFKLFGNRAFQDIWQHGISIRMKFLKTFIMTDRIVFPLLRFRALLETKWLQKKVQSSST